MANKIAIDFGNSNTVIAVWNEASQKAEILRIPGFSGAGSFLIPSRIVYEPDGRFFIGSQTGTEAGTDVREFRWMKRYINLRSPYSLRIGDKIIDARQAAEDFLRTLTAEVLSKQEKRPDELILSVPVESFEHYDDWLLRDMKRFENVHLRLIDEASAAAAGYGLNLHPGDSFLVLDFGGSTLQAVCAAVTEEGETFGRCCRVLGKAGCTLGGMSVDRWIFEHALERLRISEYDPGVNRNSADLLRYCERVKMSLSEEESVLFDYFPETPFPLTRDIFDEICRKHGLFASLDRVLEETLRMAEDHGLCRDALTAVVPVGGSCLIPSIREYLEVRFPGNKVLWGEPLGAVARGAAVIAGGMHIYDFIQHSYAVRYVDSQTGQYAFRTIVPKGTKYPEPAAAAPIRLKASYDGQSRFGIAIYELVEGDEQLPVSNEIFFNEDGSVHVMPLTDEEVRSEQRFWMNEHNPLFLHTEIPGEKGVPRFEITFGIDANKMLMINAKDVYSEKMVLSDHPVVRLI